jgi:hypothetical protein
MARSEYVYVVQADRSKNVIACFTVKHELVSWARRELANAEAPRRVLMVTRYRDGKSAGFVRMGTVQDVINDA